MTMEALWTFIEAQRSNDFLVGGVALGALGVLVATLGSAWLALSRLLWRLCAWSVTIDNRAEAYGELLSWLADQGAFARLRRFRLDSFDRPGADGGESPVLTPEAGSFWFFRDGALVLANRHIDDKPIPGGRKERLETLTLTFVTPARSLGRAVFERWLEAAATHGRSERDAWPKLYSYGEWGGWNGATRIRPRSLATLVTRDDAGGLLLEDARAFLGRERWYVERGVPWRRGYLLHGPPGAGKSSLIRAVASELSLDLAIVDLTGKGVSDAGLRDALAEAPERAALVLEDVDAAFSGRERGEASEGLTFSGLLNALDGLAAQEGRIVFMTTNHRERLDPALIRPGRADRHVALGLIGPREAAALYARFFPDEPARRRALEQAPGGEVSPAAAQAALLAEAENPAAACAALAALLAPPRPSALGVAAE